MGEYRAHWSPVVKVISALVTVICVAAGAKWFLKPDPLQPFFHWAFIPPLLLVWAAFYCVRGYAITSDSILVHRLMWDTRLPRAGIESAVYQPEAMKGSIRTCGNGGLFAVTGWYWSKQLGSYRAYATETERTVVLRYGKKTVVLTPWEPERFVAELMETRP